MNKKSSTSYQVSNMRQGPLVAVVGQTASGKSTIATQLARQFNGEIIAADSWTVRKRLDIGTAKPSAQERANAPHHMIDIIEPCDDFTAVEFQRRARRVIDDIIERGKLPLLVGGTGLYVDSVLYNYSFSPKASKTERETYNKMTITQLLAEADSRGIDTSSIDIRNKRRIIRLLETGGHNPIKQPLRKNTLILGVRLPKEALGQRIEARVEQMIADGLEQEVRVLSETYGWQCEGLKGIGYIEWRDYFEGNQSLEQTKQRIIQSTNKLAKRQHTWFKRSSDIVWCDDIETAKQQMYAFLAEK